MSGYQTQLSLAVLKLNQERQAQIVDFSYNLNFGFDKRIGPGWFRFQGAAGTRTATSCPPKFRCNTHAPGWLISGHPTVASGEVTRKVCFHWSESCCLYSINIKVKNCGSLYVYYFDSTPDRVHDTETLHLQKRNIWILGTVMEVEYLK